MKIKLYEYGLDSRLNEAAEILRGSTGPMISKRQKDIKIAEAIGIIDTLRMMVDVEYEPEEK